MTLPSGVYGYGTINFGRFFMRETYHVEETNERELVVGGQSSIADHTPSQLDQGVRPPWAAGQVGSHPVLRQDELQRVLHRPVRLGEVR